ncbi:hypothetical protein MY3296_005803 [Beauveria thailandica]
MPGFQQDNTDQNHEPQGPGGSHIAAATDVGIQYHMRRFASYNILNKRSRCPDHLQQMINK